MAERKISFSLDLTTEQAKRAVEEFTQELGKAAEGMSSKIGDFGKIGNALSDSFKKSLTEIKNLQAQIEQEMKKGVSSGIFNAGSSNSLSGKLNETLQGLIKSEYENVRTSMKAVEEQLSKSREEFAAMVKAAESGQLSPESVSAMNEQSTKISKLEAQLEGGAQQRHVLSQAMSAGNAHEAMAAISQKGFGGATPPPPPSGGGGGGGGLNLGALGMLAQLVMGQGNAVSLISPGGLMSALSAVGGLAGGGVGTAILTADYIAKAIENSGTTGAALQRQYATGGATGIDAGFLTRQVLKANPTGAYKLNQEGGGLGIVDSLDYFRSMIANGFSKSAADNYIDEKLLQEQMAGYGPNFATSYGNAIQRGGALYSSERMFGMDSTQVSGSRMQMVGVPLDRLQVGMQFMSQYMGRLPTNLRDASMLNFQNAFGLSDGAAGQMFRAGAMDPGVFNRMRLEYARSGLGGPLTDMATTSVTDAALGYASRFDAAGMSGAASPFFTGFTSAQGALPGLSPSEQARYGNEVTNSRLANLNNPGSLMNMSMMGVLGKLGITDILEARGIMSMGINNERTHQIIANMTGKSVEEVRAAITGTMGAMDKQENQRFATPRLSKAVKDVTGRDVSGPGMLKAARGLGDIDAAAAQSAFGNDQLVGPTRAQIEGFVGPTQGGRASTTTDTIKEEEAKRAGSLDMLTQVIENGALKVRIVEGAQVQRESDRTNQRTFDADKAVTGPRGARGNRGYNNFSEK